jgi:SprT-like protein
MGSDDPRRIDVDATARRYRIGQDCSREVVDRHELSVAVSDPEWRVSDRAKRRAGGVKHRGGDPRSVVLTWAQFAEPDWWVVCEQCGTRLARYRRSKLVKNPEEYACGECSGPLRVEPAD